MKKKNDYTIPSGCLYIFGAWPPTKNTRKNVSRLTTCEELKILLLISGDVPFDFSVSGIQKSAGARLSPASVGD